VAINRRLCSFAFQLAGHARAFRSEALELRRGLFGFRGVGRLLDAGGNSSRRASGSIKSSVHSPWDLKMCKKCSAPMLDVDRHITSSDWFGGSSGDSF